MFLNVVLMFMVYVVISFAISFISDIMSVSEALMMFVCIVFIVVFILYENVFNLVFMFELKF